VQTALDGGLHLAFAIPDHPWVDSADGAAVRIAMTVGTAMKTGEGKLSTVTGEREAGGEGLDVTLESREGQVHADLRIGADVAAAKFLRANGGISSPGFKPVLSSPPRRPPNSKPTPRSGTTEMAAT
jgi:hypothetical protein